jgi:hypothetical protein
MFRFHHRTLRSLDWQRLALLLVFAIASVASSLAEAPTFRWSSRAGGEHHDYGTSIAVDDFGNTFVVGYFRDVCHFDEQDKFTLTSKGEADIFVAKFDRVGTIIWVNQVGGSADDFARGVAIDAQGNCYVTGSFQSRKAEIMTNTGEEKAAVMEKQSDSEIFVLKFNNKGALSWAHTAGSGPGGSGNALTVDIEGNVYVTGYFVGTGVFEDLTLNNSGYVDIFVARYDPNGELVWVRQIGGRSDDVATSIAVDEQGSVFLAGAFSEQMQVAAKIKLKADGLFDAFLIKLDSEGRTAWAVSEGGYMNDIAYGVALDPAGNILLSGGYAGSESFASEYRTHAGYRKPRRRYTRAYFGRTRLTSEGGSDIFVAKYNPAGKMVWVQSVGGNKKGAPEAGFGIAVDARGHAHVTGTFAGKVDFGNNSLISRGIGDLYVMELDRDGRVLWARQAGAVYGRPNVGYSIAVDRGGNNYVTGAFQGNVSFGDGIVKAYGESDIFVAKITAAFMPQR